LNEELVVSHPLLRALALLAAVLGCTVAAVALIANRWPNLPAAVAAAAGVVGLGWWLHRRYKDTLWELAEYRRQQLHPEPDPQPQQQPGASQVQPPPLPQMPAPPVAAPPRKELP